MLDTHKIISIALGLLFTVVLAIFSNPVPDFRFLLPAFMAVLMVTFFYSPFYLKSLGKYNFCVILRPLLLQSSGFLLFLLLPGPFYRGLFLVVTAALIAILEITLAKFSENALLNETLLIAFGFYFSFFGFVQYFPAFASWYLLGVFMALFLLARCFYDYVPHGSNMKLLNALVASFLGTQIFWASTFLPFHYSALAVLGVSFFYVILVLNYHFLFNILSPKRAKLYLFLAGISLVLVFSATPWRVMD